MCWGTVDGGDLFDLARVAAGAGIPAITVAPRQYLDQVDAGLSDAQMRRHLADLGVTVAAIDPLIAPMPGLPPLRQIAPSMHWLFEPDARACWRAAEALGVNTINLTHFLGEPVSEEEIGAAMARIAEANRAHGCSTLIEFIPGTGVPDLVTAGRLTRDVPDLRIMFDCWHFARSGGTLADIAALPSGAIGGVQINDWSPPEAGAPYVPMSGRLMPGDGSLPLSRILSLIERNAPGLPVGIEVFNAGLREIGWDAAASALVERTRPLLACQAST